MKAFVQHQYNESDKLVLLALIPFVELNRKALFTQKVLYNDVVSDRNLADVEGNAEYYQRRLDTKRLKEIKKYIYNSILDEKDSVAVSALFPTAMILAIDHEESIVIKEDIVDLEFDEQQRLYIVDGQHRLMAMRQLYDDLKKALFLSEEEEYILNYLNNYKFNCTILINYDIWEQGQVFVNVNFKQKPVNRSLYYDVFGAEYIDSRDPKHLERNKIYLAHELTRFMNDYKESPFYKNIKMLGTGKGYVSQSFFVEALLPLFKNTGIWYYDSSSSMETSYILNECKSELFNYYLTVSKCFEKYWGIDKDNKVNFICKTTGVGAFTKMMSVLHKQLPVQIIQKFKTIKAGTYYPAYADEIRNYLTPIVEQQDILFGPDSSYGKTGGKGIEDTLFKRMLRILQEKGLLKDPGERPYQMFSGSLKKTLSANNLKRLKDFGVTEIEEDLNTFMNAHLPSEVDALGTHCRIEEVDDVEISSLVVDIENDMIVTGVFDCSVSIAYDNEPDSEFSMNFPGAFTLRFIKNGEKLEITEEGTKIFVNTDSYYR